MILGVQYLLSTGIICGKTSENSSRKRFDVSLEKLQSKCQRPGQQIKESTSLRYFERKYTGCNNPSSN